MSRTCDDAGKASDNSVHTFAGSQTHCIDVSTLSRPPTADTTRKLSCGADSTNNKLLIPIGAIGHGWMMDGWSSSLGERLIVCVLMMSDGGVEMNDVWQYLV